MGGLCNYPKKQISTFCTLSSTKHGFKMNEGPKFVSYNYLLPVILEEYLTPGLREVTTILSSISRVKIIKQMFLACLTLHQRRYATLHKKKKREDMQLTICAQLRRPLLRLFNDDLLIRPCVRPVTQLFIP